MTRTMIAKVSIEVSDRRRVAWCCLTKWIAARLVIAVWPQISTIGCRAFGGRNFAKRAYSHLSGSQLNRWSPETKSRLWPTSP
ncbi:MAG TPA: hypothetical protein VGR06_34270 [Actinophytocola sp.]|uniref:hypothetical protein n=1 Tax=Actinophytocola sp. TaxID=1872138 RepID=UPI002E0AC49B|nr:hypothetical protein [Actinophytocola sp.]